MARTDLGKAGWDRRGVPWRVEHAHDETSVAGGLSADARSLAAGGRCWHAAFTAGEQTAPRCSRPAPQARPKPAPQQRAPAGDEGRPAPLAWPFRTEANGGAPSSHQLTISARPGSQHHSAQQRHLSRNSMNPPVRRYARPLQLCATSPP
ncbi:uncharacterized protein BDR25DRAFT_319817 [Lindgomyces ingoldianus]|uniref:Uncharacterized protein n=1 Tax=Lindgomyces ingoldianus TaxID=673940 RepID=A0ACB6QBT4_9PLEO|nr:uncharacterized protein BDR25DRAFT_319817 [Lindgomyces ingoldianus]KAF2463611.1 hypothetical protein BDR25DRAFT_319817 [Lindgomyces ingoldianus]